MDLATAATAEEMSPVKRFYADKTLLITGVTGLVGRVLLQRLLTQCSDVRRIYVLIRPKRGESVSQRLDKILASPLFAECDRKRLVTRAIEGDIEKPGLGIGPADRETLVSTVQVMFHSAASTNFNGSLKDNCSINLMGPRHVLALCRDMTALECLVHVSTAYSNFTRRDVGEMVYPAAESYENMIKLLETETRESLDGKTVKLLGPCPNTYCFSKSLAENLVAAERGRMSVAIVRPSIVATADRDPNPGWIDTLQGFTGLSVLATTGVLRTIMLDPENRADIIPVDIVCNAIISAGWFSATQRPHELRVYNVTSGSLNPLTWRNLMLWGNEIAGNAPSMKSVRSPLGIPSKRPTQFENTVKKLFGHVLFSVVFDLIMVLLGKKPVLMNVVRKMHVAMRFVEEFSVKEWNFACDNVLELIDRLTPADRLTFRMDIREVKWKDYVFNGYMGLRRNVLKDDDSSIPMALKRMQRISFIYSSVMNSLVAVLLAVVAVTVYLTLNFRHHTAVAAIAGN